jgi:hypothetical protein
MAREAPDWIPKMRGKYALEGPELGALMAEAMKLRQKSNTTTAQRKALLQEMALGGGGPAGRAREEAETIDREYWTSRLASAHAMKAEEDRQLAQEQAQLAMADATGRGLQLPYDWGTTQTGATQSEEDALMAQMAADFANPSAPSNVEVDAAGTPGGFTTGENQYLQNLAQKEQFPQAFVGQGSSQFGGTELGMVPEGRRTGQGFSAKDYDPGEKQVQEVDLIGRKIQEFLSGSGQKGAVAEAEVAGTEVGTALGAEVPLGDDLSPQEQQLLQQEKQQLAAATAEAGASGSSQHISVPDSTFPSIGGTSGEVKEVSGEEQNAAIVQSLLDALESAGVEANDLRMLDIDVDKFISGVYNMADVDKLRIAARIAGVPANLRGRIETMSQNVSGTSGRGFDWKDQKYDEGVGLLQSDKYGRQKEEDFMDYTKRMHERLYPSG